VNVDGRMMGDGGMGGGGLAFVSGGRCSSVDSGGGCGIHSSLHMKCDWFILFSWFAITNGHCVHASYHPFSLFS